MRPHVFLALLASSALAFASPDDYTDWHHEELRRFPAVEAKQGVAVDKEHFYAISNQAIGKYRKHDGTRVAEWKQEKGGTLVHMNAAFVWQDRLYAAHSNFPEIPNTSSVEVWNTATMEHVASYSLGIASGSLTWVEMKDGGWYACFAQYSKDKPRTGKDPSWTEVVKYDSEWRRQAGWVFPKGVVEKFGGASCSGGGFGPGGHLFCTGHDNPELYILDLPQSGSTLKWIATVPISAEGQAFSWDATAPGTLYSISRRTKEVIVSRVYQEPAPAK